MADRTETEEKLEVVVSQDTTPATTEAKELVEAQQQTAKALATIAEALTPARLQETLTGFAKAQAVGQLAAAMLQVANKNGLDARNYERIETETAHVLGKIFDKAMKHLSSGGGTKKEDLDPVVKDAESEFRKWLEDNDPGDEDDGK